QGRRTDRPSEGERSAFRGLPRRPALAAYGAVRRRPPATWWSETGAGSASLSSEGYSLCRGVHAFSSRLRLGPAWSSGTPDFCRGAPLFVAQIPSGVPKVYSAEIRRYSAGLE